MVELRQLPMRLGKERHQPIQKRDDERRPYLYAHIDDLVSCALPSFVSECRPVTLRVCNLKDTGIEARHDECHTQLTGISQQLEAKRTMKWHGMVCVTRCVRHEWTIGALTSNESPNMTKRFTYAHLDATLGRQVSQVCMD